MLNPEKIKDTIENYNVLCEIIETNNMTAQEVLDLFINWHGMQLLSPKFMENIEDEGYSIPDEYLEDEE